MRPIRLDIDGFASYREPATVDFTDVDYFALVGPTGSGKSTIVDAMTFALYGTAHRWERSNAVAYALAPTSTRCTVSLIFDVGGQRYQAVREVRRVGKNIQQKNARLERFHDPTVCPAPGDPAPGSDVLAAEVRDMTPAVSDLLGLDFDDFCQCVVLPQGEFAQFLKAKASDRQTILLKLLGADQYEAIAKEAGIRASDAEKQADLYTEQLGQYEHATQEALDDATGRRDRLRALTFRVPELVAPVLTARDAEIDQRNRMVAAKGAVSALISVQMPDGVMKRHAELLIARDTRQSAQASLTETNDVMARAVEASIAGPQRTDAIAIEARYAEQEDVTAELTRVSTAKTAQEDEELATSRVAAQTQQHARDARTAEKAAEEAHSEATGKVERLTERRERITQVLAQEDVGSTIGAVHGAEARAAEAEEWLERARTAAAAAAQVCAQMPDLRAVATTTQQIHRIFAEADQWTSLLAALEDRTHDRTAADAALLEATAVRQQAESRLESEQIRAGAAALRPTLQAGHACPVCTQMVTTLPSPAETVDLDAARETLRRAQVAWSAADKTHRQATRERDAVEQQAEAAARSLQELLAQASATLAGYVAETGLSLTVPKTAFAGKPLAPPAVVAFAEQARTVLARIEDRCIEAKTAKELSESARESAEQDRDKARRVLDEANRQLNRVRSALVAARTTVADDGAPLLELTDAEAVATGWTALRSWAVDDFQRLQSDLLPAAHAKAADSAAALDQRQQRRTVAERAEQEASRLARIAAEAAATARARHESLTSQQVKLATQLEDAPPREALPGLLAEADRLEAERNHAITQSEQPRMPVSAQNGRHESWRRPSARWPQTGMLLGRRGIGSRLGSRQRSTEPASTTTCPAAGSRLSSGQTEK